MAILQPLVSYSYQGPYLRAGKELRRGIEPDPTWQGKATYDPTRRLETWSSTNKLGHRVFEETLTWYPRNVKETITRGDLNGASLTLGYDGASRLLSAERPANATTAFTAGLPRKWGYRYNEAQNMYERTEEGCCGETTQVAMPPDDSQRNRPKSVGGVSLAWDASGNLKTKGPYTYHYDYRNRLIKVEHSEQATVEYSYDVFNRRVEKRTVGGSTETTVWSGWQEIETYVNDVHTERRTYGASLDEIVRFENITSGLTYLPVYDHTGNVVMMLDDYSGRPVERYEYSPFGERWIFVDSTPPEIEQIRVKDGAIWLELSEQVDSAELQQAVGDGRLVLNDDDQGTGLDFTIDQPVSSGRQAGRRLVIAPATSPAAGTQVTLGLYADTLRDFFGNSKADTFTLTMEWPVGDEIVSDVVPPRLEQVCVENGVLEVQFSEEVDIGTATDVILVDGMTRTWSLDADRYTLIDTMALPDGMHELSVTAGAPLDLNDPGRGLELGLESEVFPVGAGAPASQVVWSSETDSSTPSSAAGNVFGFHGRQLDSETGLVYMRNRYYDPNLGQFITIDPLGYIDGPSAYQFTGNSPFNYRDSLGLYQTDVHFYVVYYLGRLAGFSSDDAYSIAYGSQYVDDHKFSEPLWNSLAGWRKGKATAFHFLAPVRQGDDDLGRWGLVTENNIFANAAVAAAARSGDLTRLGVSLHTLADSFSHAGFNVKWDSHNRRSGSWWRPNLGHADTAHSGTEPDLPFLDQPKAMRMTRSLLMRLQDAYRRIYKRDSPKYSRFEVGLIRSELELGFAAGQVQEELTSLSRVEENMNDRISMWKALIHLRFNEDVEYDKSQGSPKGWYESVYAHLYLAYGMTDPGPGQDPIGPNMLLRP